jgi:hypothetical protein
MPLFIKSCLKKCVSVSPAIMLPEKSWVLLPSGKEKNHQPKRQWPDYYIL